MATDAVTLGAHAQRAALDRQLRRYARGYRRQLRKLARSSSRLADLVYSYPAAAFVIAAHQGNPLLRAEAIALVKDGAGLPVIAERLRLPLWTRRLPPETFTGGFGALPASARFNKQIVNLIPKHPGHCAKWFQWVTKADALCHEDFALWVARQKFWYYLSDDPEILLPLAAFVWFADAEGTRARGMIETPWTPQLGFGKAIEAARGWFVRLLLEDCRGRRGPPGRWLVAQKSSGLRIIPLRQRCDLADEGRRMHNCVADYATAVAAGGCLIYSVRRGNAHVATLEIKPDHAMDGGAHVAQLLGPYNDEVTEAVSRAVASWLRRQGRYPIAARENFALVGFDKERWDALWAPFFAAKGRLRTPGGQRANLQPMQMHRALEALACYV